MLSIMLLWSTLLLQAPAEAIPEIESVIQEQLDAFNFNDYETAYRLASKAVHDRLSQEAFERDVRADYLPLTKTIRVAFNKIDVDPDQIHATVRIEATAFNHKKITAEYRLVHEEEAWKIDGMAILPVRTSVGRGAPE